MSQDAAMALRALVVDDEKPVLDELVYLLGRDERIASVRAAQSGTEALRVLEAGDVDLVFLDVAMPGLNGLEIAKLLARFAHSPRIVFVTAHDAHAVDAFELNAVDYLLKPIREERLRESVRRATADTAPSQPKPDDTIAVELGGVTRFVSRSTVSYAEAQGDYVRLHTLDGTSHLIRTPLGALADEWDGAGFVRIHRSTVINLAHVREVRMVSGRCSIVVPFGANPVELQVARRHVRTVRERIQDRAS